jgi:putative tricarboxylic transport membrane protein
MMATIVAALCTVAVSIGARAQGWSPQKHVEIVVGSAPGGINDRTARVIEKVISDHKLAAGTLLIMNRPGGGGNIAANYVHQRARDPHTLMVATTALASSHIVGSGKLRHTDFTPIASLLEDYLVFVVNPGSAITTGKDLTARLQKDPQSVTVGFANAIGNHNHVAAGLLLKAMGGNARNLKVVVYKGSSEAITSLLGGHIDVIPTAAGNAAPHIASGKLRGVAISAAQRFPGVLESVPTWKEHGIDLVSGGWRAIFAPPGIEANQAAYWEEVLRKMTQTAEWKAYLEKNYSAPLFLTGEALQKYLDEDYAAAKSVLTDLGLVK